MKFRQIPPTPFNKGGGGGIFSTKAEFAGIQSLMKNYEKIRKGQYAA